MDALEFADLPGLAGLFARAAATGVGRPGAAAPLPDRVARVASHTQDLARLAAYDRLCGFGLTDRVPPTWLHVLTFPLQVALMAERDFPFALAGLVHASNAMTLHRPVTVADELELSVRAADVRPHRRGALFDLVGEVRLGGELAWSGRSTYLAVGKPVASSGGPVAASVEPVETKRERSDHTPSQQWRLPADLGRRYAAVSGDVNPVHLYPLTARAFGFRRPIIHGMWTHARALAALAPRLPEAYSVSVQFTKPILLPARVGFAARAAASGTAFSVTNREGKPCLVGEVIPGA